jgi:hypothetical protein
MNEMNRGCTQVCKIWGTVYAKHESCDVQIVFEAGLPDFMYFYTYQNYFFYILEDLVFIFFTIWYTYIFMTIRYTYLWQFGIHIYDNLIYFWPFGIFYGLLVYFVVVWYVFSVLVSCTKKNLATLAVEQICFLRNIRITNVVKTFVLQSWMLILLTFQFRFRYFLGLVIYNNL